MINPHNVAKLLTDYVAKLSPSTVQISDHIVRDTDVAKQLYENLISILNSNQYRFANEHTLDFIYDLHSLHYCNDSDEEESAEDDTDFDKDIIAEENFLHDFSLEYIQKAVYYYVEKDPTTGKKKHSWKRFHHSFKNVPDRKCLSRFRKYLTAHGTKRMKLNEIDKFVYIYFEKDREQLLSIHP
jgi:hypothetical protein